jgi:hypothetical protein
LPPRDFRRVVLHLMVSSRETKERVEYSVRSENAPANSSDTLID